MTRHLTLACLLGLVSFSVFAVDTASGQDDANPKMTLVVYQVGDLLVSRPNYTYPGSEIPTTSSRNMNFPTAGGSIGGGIGGQLGGTGGQFGGGMGGFGGGGGGGFFSVNSGPVRAQFGGGSGSGSGGFNPAMTGTAGHVGNPAAGVANLQFDMNGLMDAIQSTVDPATWDTQGGDGVCTALGGMLIIRQTASAHEQIGQLLESIRREGGASSTVTIKARWLRLNDAQLQQLFADDGGGSDVDADALGKVAGQPDEYRGRITCFNNQTVHLISGERRSTVVGAIPVVGNFVLGYQPVMQFPNIGALLQVSPSVQPGGKEAVINVESTVTSLLESDGESSTITLAAPEVAESKDAKSVVQAPTIPIDRLRLQTEHLATTLRVPLGKPVLVGGLSSTQISPRDRRDDRGEARQLYLFVEVDVNP